MKVSGVITEYNPFHNGHKYQLEQIKKQTGCDYTVIVMSGNFVQRGQPAITDKYSRTKMALECGADLVLELPVVCATASAEYFATGGVEILKSTGVVDTLCYGVETADHELIRQAASVLCNPPEDFSVALSKYMQSGMSYPAARVRALCDISDSTSSGNIYNRMSSIMSSPNNILGIEYEKALIGSSITGFPIQRIGEGYHSTNADTPLASATAIRNLLTTDSNASAGHKELSALMPDSCAKILYNCFNEQKCVFPDDISDMLYYKLLSQKDCGFEKYADCSKELSAKIVKNIYKYESFTQFCDLLKSKNITYTRISRVLTHILLDITADDHSVFMSNPYIRILGFKKSSTNLLHEIKKRASAPIITKVADAPYELISKNIFAADVYSRLCSSTKNEFTHGPVIV